MAVQTVLHCMRLPSCTVGVPRSFLLLCMRISFFKIITTTLGIWGATCT